MSKLTSLRLSHRLEGDIPDELGLDAILEVVRNKGKNCWHKNWTWELEDLGSNPDRN